MKTKLLLLHFLLPLFVFAQFTQIGEDIDGEAAEDQSSKRAVSLSADGGIVAIGALWNDGNGDGSGHVRVYQNTGGIWSQIGQDIDGEASGDDSGTSVSLSDDGSIVAIGAPLHDGANPWSGQVRIYQNTGGTWTQLGQDIESENADDHCGSAVSLNGDGTIVAIGSERNDGNGSNSGHVRIFQYTGDSWTQIGEDIDGEYAGDWSGTPNSVSLNTNGNIVAIGSKFNYGNGAEAGHVRIYQNTGDAWTQIGQDIDGEAADDRSGNSVSLSADGNIVAIGAGGNDGNGDGSGHVRIYQYIGGAWTQLGQDIDGEHSLEFSGYVSLNDDGSIVAIGAPQNNGINGDKSGHVRIYQNIGDAWTQIGTDIDGEAADDRSGNSVSLSADGSIVAIGAFLNDGNGSNTGHVRVFDLGIQQTLQASFASNTTNTCIQEIVEFYDESTGGVVGWDWTFEGGSPSSSTSQNPVVVYIMPGVYDVTLTVGDGMEYSTITLEDYMTVISEPDTPETPAGDDEVCTNFISTSEYVISDAMYAESYEWEILPAEAGTIDGTGTTGTVTWTLNWEGTAAIKVKSINEACGESEPSDAFEVDCSICTGIGEYDNLKGIQVYPNPSNGRFRILGIDKGEYTISIYSLTGKCVYRTDLNIPESKINVSQLPQGIYFYRIQAGGQQANGRLVMLGSVR